MTLTADVEKLRVEMQTLTNTAEQNRLAISRHEEQISGQGGLTNANNRVVAELTSIKRGIWAVGVGIVLASIGFGFTVLQLVGQ